MTDNRPTLISPWSIAMSRVAITLAATLVVVSCSDSGCRSSAAAPSARPMPDGPLAEQARPPCHGTAEVPQVELRGACWVQVQAPKGESRDIVAHEGKYYVPAAHAQDREPNNG